MIWCPFPYSEFDLYTIALWHRGHLGFRIPPRCLPSEYTWHSDSVTLRSVDFARMGMESWASASGASALARGLGTGLYHCSMFLDHLPASLPAFPGSPASALFALDSMKQIRR